MVLNCWVKEMREVLEGEEFLASEEEFCANDLVI